VQQVKLLPSKVIVHEINECTDHTLPSYLKKRNKFVPLLAEALEAVQQQYVFYFSLSFPYSLSFALFIFIALSFTYIPSPFHLLSPSSSILSPSSTGESSGFLATNL
jgi:hypothetical protein